MHPNPAFRGTSDDISLSFARDRGFGVLAVADNGAPLLAHVPFLVSEDGTWIDLHLVRSNPIARVARNGATARLDVLGPDGYVSPDWYGIDNQVPTWNYVAVSFSGRLSQRPVDELEQLLARQSAAYEARLAPKPAWTMDKMTQDTRSRFLRMILPFRLQIDAMTSTWKLGQNKSDTARHSAAANLTQGFGTSLAELAALMQDPPHKT